MKYCSQCGASAEKGAAFCSGCGGSLTASPASPAGSTTGFWKGVAASIFGIVVVVGGLWATMGSNSADPDRGKPVASAAELEDSMPADEDAAADVRESEDVVIEEPGFVGRLLGEEPRVFVTVSEGESLALGLRDAISTETAETGDRFRSVLTASVVVEGRDALPEGTLVSGHVAHAARSDKVKGVAQLILELDSLELPSGEEHPFQADPIHFEARSTQKNDAVKIGAAGGIGALVGGIVGGKKGAAIGAGVGAGAGTGVVLTTRGEEVVLGEGSQLTTVLRTDLTVELIEDDAP